MKAAAKPVPANGAKGQSAQGPGDDSGPKAQDGVDWDFRIEPPSAQEFLVTARFVQNGPALPIIRANPRD